MNTILRNGLFAATLLACGEERAQNHTVIKVS